MKNHVHSRGLDSASKYANAFSVHINPAIGERLAELLTREEVRDVMERARFKRKRPSGQPGAKIGGVEAARTAVGVLRHMFSWAIEEAKLGRQSNPCSNLTRNLPAKKERDVVLSHGEARTVWEAEKDTGYPFGTHIQLMLLTGCRLDEWASAQIQWVDFDQALVVIPRDHYKSDHVHVVPLVPQAVQILKALPRQFEGGHLLSGDGGRTRSREFQSLFRPD